MEELNLVREFHETFKLIGGWEGVFLMTLIMLGFYIILSMMITGRRTQKQIRKSR